MNFLEGISARARKLTDEEMESALFPSVPKCLMDTPEFSQEKKTSRPLFNREAGQAPFSQRYYFFTDD